jgi:hypothetical protein
MGELPDRLEMLSVQASSPDAGIEGIVRLVVPDPHHRAVQLGQ